jgi:hypothetical protein
LPECKHILTYTGGIPNPTDTPNISKHIQTYPNIFRRNTGKTLGEGDTPFFVFYADIMLKWYKEHAAICIMGSAKRQLELEMERLDGVCSIRTFELFLRFKGIMCDEIECVIYETYTGVWKSCAYPAFQAGACEPYRISYNTFYVVLTKGRWIEWDYRGAWLLQQHPYALLGNVVVASMSGLRNVLSV